MVEMLTLGVIGTLFFALVLYLILYYLFWQFFFLRDPQRAIPVGKESIIAPADGKVIAVSTYDFRKNTPLVINKGYLGAIRTLAGDVGKRVTIISIFMSPFDVHINRAPCDGKVISTTWTKGRFYNAADLERSLMNEKVETLIQSDFGKVKVIQIAGFVARRIESFVREGQVIAKGQRIGLINLGSQVTLLLPAEKVAVKVTKGERVKAGESIVAEVL